jgi:hypothetical protein
VVGAAVVVVGAAVVVVGAAVVVVGAAVVVVVVGGGVVNKFKNIPIALGLRNSGTITPKQT